MTATTGVRSGLATGNFTAREMRMLEEIERLKKLVDPARTASSAREGAFVFGKRLASAGLFFCGSSGYPLGRSSGPRRSLEIHVFGCSDPLQRLGGVEDVV